MILLTVSGLSNLPGKSQGMLSQTPGDGAAGVIEVISGQKSEIKSIKDRLQADKNRMVSITISFAGDCTLGTDESFSYINSFPYQLEKQDDDYSYFFRNVRNIFKSDDLTIVNLETTLTDADRGAEKKYRFKGESSYVNIIKSGCIEMVNISNNHIYDYLRKGFDDTIRALEGAGIKYCGEGRIAYFKIKGVTIACIGNKKWNPSLREDLIRDINEAKKRADLVVVSIHWGTEGKNYPGENQMELGRLCIDEGADIVAGHHPHVIQGIEKYGGRYIVYSLGNFCFGGNHNPSDKDAFIFQNTFTLRDGKIVGSEGKIIPCSISSTPYINDYQPRILEGKDRERVLKRIFQYSSRLRYGISEDSF